MKSFVAAAITLLLVAACAGTPSKEAVLSISDETFSAEHFTQYIKRNTHPEKTGVSRETLDALFENYITEQLLLVSALKEKGEETAAADIPAEETENIRHAYIEKHVASEVVVGEEEIRSRYDADKENLRAPARAAVRYVYITDEDTLKNVMRVLTNGEASFEEISLKYASSTTDAQIHIYEKGTLPENFEDAIFSLKVGGISRPVETGQGHYLFELVEIKPARDLTYEEAKQEIEKKLLEIKLNEALDEHIKALKKSRQVKIFPKIYERTAKELTLQ